jgi:hypothetical protein
VATHVVLLSARTTVWKEVETSAGVIAQGDFLYVNGRPLAEGAVDARRIWVNIGWYHGRLAEVNADSVRVDLGRGTRLIYLTGLTLLFKATQPAAHFEGQLALGQRVDALGVFVPGGHMRATRIWVN